MWGGRFSEPPSEALWRFTVDHSDRRLLSDDIAGSLAHVAMLGEVGILDQADVDAITVGLEEIRQEAADGGFDFLETDEDVHSAVERRLYELVGAPAGKLHTGRSRNDQIALDIRLYLRRAAAARIDDLLAFASLIADRSDATGEAVVAAYTHLQQAQPIRLGTHLLAYGWMAVRDAERFAGVSGRLGVSPLGAGAAAGSSLPLDPAITAAALGFDRTFDNSIDAVGSRDLVAEYAFCCAQAMTHLSRLAEDLVLWSTSEFGWIDLDDAYATGSSALPHKKNPDIAELTRGKAAAVAADVATLLGIQKGTPLAYNRDLQEDKRAVFHADDTLAAALPALGGMLATARFHPPQPDDRTVALDVAEALVTRGVPFREAHEAVGRLVAAIGDADLSDATPEQLAGAHPLLTLEDVPSVGEAAARRPAVADEAARLRAACEALGG
ncbi:MAG: argininosuccinate lyase [Acidimicrobiia bacterium]|nr:argininosuccinate lyase [Acidimicrobiia bacterium]